jgi:hypothetical protein
MSLSLLSRVTESDTRGGNDALGERSMTKKELGDTVENLVDSITLIQENRAELRSRKFLANLVGDVEEEDHFAEEIFRADLGEKRLRERLDALQHA